MEVEMRVCFPLGYLKLFQLRKLQITGYDCILVDEAQDLTPGMEVSSCYLHTCIHVQYD